jgi:hypothetical protein
MKRMMVAACAAGALLWMAVEPASGQLPNNYKAPRFPGSNVPDLNGIWQHLGTANWNIEDHSAGPASAWEVGSIAAIPAGQSVVQGGPIPYTAAGLEKRNENFKKRRAEDPEAKCYMPGIPRANYMPYPFQIVQSNQGVLFVYEYATANRFVNMGKAVEAATDTWMGTNNGRWEGESLVIDVTGLNGLAWFDRAGNHSSDRVHVVERFTAVSPYHLRYDATIEDARTFTRPWNMSLMLYRRVEPGAQILEFKCVEFSEDLLYGQFKKEPTKPTVELEKGAR